MRRTSDSFPLVLVGGGLGLWILFHTIWNILFEDWLKAQLERLTGHTVAEVIERFGSIGLPALAEIALVWFLYDYIRAHANAEPARPPTRLNSATRRTAAFDSSWTRDVSLSDALWRTSSGAWGLGCKLPLSEGSNPELDRLEDAADKLMRIVLFEACSAFTRVAACTLALSPIRDTLIEGFSHFVTFMTAPIASGCSGCRVGLAPTGKRRLCTAHTHFGLPRGFVSSFPRSATRHEL